MSRADGKKYSLKEEDFFVAVYYTLDSREVRNFLCFLIKNKNTTQKSISI